MMKFDRLRSSAELYHARRFSRLDPFTQLSLLNPRCCTDPPLGGTAGPSQRCHVSSVTGKKITGSDNTRHGLNSWSTLDRVLSMKWQKNYTYHCFLLVSEAFEDLHHGVSDGVDHLVVVVVEGHLNIQTHELGQVAVGVGVLGPEDWKTWTITVISKTNPGLNVPLI